MRKTRIAYILGAALILCFAVNAAAQDRTRNYGIPDEVFYLMPKFGNGIVYLRGQAPAEGKMNICAVDNTLRFLDKKGEEMTSGNNESIIKVRIDSVLFLRFNNAFYRLYPVTSEIGIARRRNVDVIKDAKEGGYGTTTRTSSVQSYGAIYSDGTAYKLDHEQVYPYEVSEKLYVYVRDAVVPFTKKNLLKIFPDKQEEIKAYFKYHRGAPDKVEDAVGQLSGWAN